MRHEAQARDEHQREQQRSAGLFPAAHDGRRFAETVKPAPFAAVPTIVTVDAFAQLGAQVTVGGAFTSATSRVDTNDVPVQRWRTSVIVEPEVCVVHEARKIVPSSVQVMVASALPDPPHGAGSGAVTVSADSTSVVNSEITDRIEVSSANTPVVSAPCVMKNVAAALNGTRINPRMVTATTSSTSVKPCIDFAARTVHHGARFTIINVRSSEPSPARTSSVSCWLPGSVAGHVVENVAGERSPFQ